MTQAEAEALADQLNGDAVDRVTHKRIARQPARGGKSSSFGSLARPMDHYEEGWDEDSCGQEAVGSRGDASVRPLWAAGVVIVLLVGCGDSGDGSRGGKPSGRAQGTTAKVSPGTAADSEGTVDPRRLGPSETCPGAARFKDGARDSRAWAMPAPADRAVAPPSGDARELRVRADRKGLCVAFELRGPVKPGTELHFSAHGPPVRSPSGGTVFHGYGFKTVLSKGEDSVLNFGLRGDRPNVLDGKVVIGRTTVVVTIPRRELHRAPTNMPGRPPFPYRGFGVEGRVIGPASRGGGTEADFIPTEGTGSVGIKDGKACRAPCGIGLLAIQGPRRGG